MMLATFLLIAAAIVAFGACYTWWVWSQVRGLREAMIGWLQTSLVAMLVLSAALFSPYSPIPFGRIIVALVAALVSMVFPSAVLSDLYAADHNDHRSFTTRSFQWYKRTASRLREKPRTRSLGNESRT